MTYVDPLQSIMRGQQFVSGLAQQRGAVDAGRALAGNNYAGAIQSLLRAGNLQGGMALQDRQAEQVALQRQTQDQDLAKQIAFTRQATRSLRSAMQQGQDPLAAYDQLAPAFAQVGATPDQVQQYRQALAADPQGFLTNVERLVGEQERKLQIQNLGGGYGVAIDEATGEVVNEYRAPQAPMSVGGVLIDPVTQEVILDTREPKYQTITNSDGSTTVVAIDQPAPVRGTGRGSGDVNSILDGIIQREGGFVARDGRSGAPANFGINQRANPDIDVRKLTEGQARQIYRDRYIQPILEAGVSGPALEAVIDFGVNAGVNRSLDFWRRSGGDINEFNRLRLEHYRSLPDYQQNARSWERRVAETTPGQSGASVPVGGGTRIVAQGQNLGPRASELRAEQRQQTQDERAQRKTETDLRREFNARQEVKDFRSVEASYQNVRSAASNPTAAGDLSMIFAYMKMLDPGSVVREQEFANAQNAAGVPDQIRNLYNRALNGQRLNPNQRRDFLGQAERLYQSRRQNVDQISAEYRSYAEDYGVDPDRVVRQQARQPRVRFQLTPQQQQWVAQNGQPEGSGTPRQPGSRENPRLINPQNATQSYNNIPRGAYFLTPDGELRQKR